MILMISKAVEIVIANYHNTNITRLMELTGLPAKKIYQLSSKYNLRKSKEYMIEENKIRSARLAIVGVNFRILTGNIPANKGQKMSKELYDKVKHTFFSKGHLPYNVKYDGYERTSKDGYVEMRISQGKFVLKHRTIYQQHHGKISKDSIIVFKDGNKSNFDINNLEAITKAENMKRNTIHRYPTELKKLIRLSNKLSHKINQRINEEQN